MTAFDEAFTRAASGLDWSFPCLIWIADYLRSETGRDPAAEWRSIAWNEDTAKRELVRLGLHGKGETRVEKALSVVASREGWTVADGARQGACMIGVYTDVTGEGAPAIFDGWRGWLIAGLGQATILRDAPDRMWEVPR
jgi:hypothetical protein